MTNEQMHVALELAEIVSENNKKEQEAVKGYTEQLQVIQRAKEAFPDDAEVLAMLEQLEAQTREKIADELNHSNSLTAEYTSITDIRAKED